MVATLVAPDRAHGDRCGARRRLWPWRAAWLSVWRSAFSCCRRDEPPARGRCYGPRGRPEQQRILVVANETLSGRGAARRDRAPCRRRGYGGVRRVPRPQHEAEDLDARTTTGPVRGRTQRLQGMLPRAPTGTVLKADRRHRRRRSGAGAGGRPAPVFGADEVIVSTHPPGRSHWLERDVVERSRERFDVPITHVVVDLERERVRTWPLAAASRRSYYLTASVPFIPACSWPGTGIEPRCRPRDRR